MLRERKLGKQKIELKNMGCAPHPPKIYFKNWLIKFWKFESLKL
jgi:hypothetical protein